MNVKTPHNRLLEKIRQGKVASMYVVGNFVGIRHVDFISRSGYFDSIWFDLEHFDIQTRDLANYCLVCRASPVTPIARLKITDYQSIVRVLEVGVGGVMCSMVADAEEARRIVSWAKFNNPAPVEGEVIGQRGWNGGNIDSGYAAYPASEYISYQNTQTMIICQIENEAALKNAAAIAAVPGVDGLFFGPGDFSTSIGLPGQIAHERVFDAMQTVAEAANRSGKFWGTVTVRPEHYQRAVAMGARLLCPGGDLKVMTLGVKELAKTIGING